VGKHRPGIGAEDDNLIRGEHAMKHLLAAASAGVLGLILAGSASAQYGFRPLAPPNWGPGYRAPLNPYLNLTRPGDPSTNYFLGTIPEIQRRQAYQDLRTFEDDTLARERQLGEDLPNVRPVVSGTYSLVNNTGGYFNNTYNYFGNAARPSAPLIRQGQYTKPPQRPGSPLRSGTSPGFAPNPTGTTTR
jgi:hypothetical protein